MRATPAHPCCCRAACPLLTGGAAFVDRRGSARAWPAHKDHGPQGPHRRCRQEKGLDERHHYLRRGRGEGVSRRAGERCRVHTHASTAMRSFQPSAFSHAACYASERGGAPSLVVCDLVGFASCIILFSVLSAHDLLSSAEPSTVWDLIVPVIVLEPDKERESERDVNNTPGHTSKYLERVTEYRATGPPGSLRSLRSRPPCRLQLA